MAIINNGTATASPADALPNGHSLAGVFIFAESADLRFNIGANAGASAGELIKSGTGRYIGDLRGQRLSVFCATTTPYSIRDTVIGS